MMAGTIQKGAQWLITLLKDNWELVIVIIGVFFLLSQLKPW